MNAVAEPPSPRTIARSTGRPDRIAASVDTPSTRSSRTISVFTDGASVSQSAAAACLCGAVTFAPTKPSAARPRIASSTRSGGVGSGT